MRSFPPSWNKTLTRLGFRRRKADKRGERRRSRLESLERRELLSVSPPHSQIVADLDGDGVLQVVTAASSGVWTVAAHEGNESWRVFANDGGLVGAQSLPDGFAVGDFNGDGRDDVLGSRNGGWSQFRVDDHADEPTYDGVLRATVLRAGDSPVTWSNLFVGDFNGDGRDDIGTLESGVTLKVAASTGDGFLAAETYATLDTPHLADSVQPGDFNGDGRDDLWFVQSETLTTATRTLLTSNGTSFSAVPEITNNWWHRTLVGDVDGDGVDELVGRRGWNFDWEVIQYSSGEVPIVESDWGRTIDANDPTMTISTGDINGDGRDDLIGRNSSHDTFVSVSQPAAGASGEFAASVGGVDVDAWFGHHDPPGLLQPGDADGRVNELVQIYNDVYNNVELELYPGLMKGPTATEQTQAGNPWDQAALLVDKLNAAGFTASIAHVNAAARFGDVARWLGMESGASASAVRDLIKKVFSDRDDLTGSSGSIIRWVHAVVKVRAPGPLSIARDYYLDPSWKFRDQRDGVTLDIANATPSYSVDDGRVTRGAFDEFGYLSDAGRDELPIEWYAEQVQDYLAETYGDKSVADISREGPILQRSFSRLDEIAVLVDYGGDTDLPDGITITDEHGSYTSAAALPDSLKHTVTIGVEGIAGQKTPTPLAGTIRHDISAGLPNPVSPVVVDPHTAWWTGPNAPAPPQPPSPSLADSDGRLGFAGNEYLAIPLPSAYDVTADTVVKFVYSSSYSSFSGVGPSPDPPGPGSANMLQLMGFDTGTFDLQSLSIIGSDIYESGDGFQEVTVQFSQPLTGATRLVFGLSVPTNEDPDGHWATVRDIEIYENTSATSTSSASYNETTGVFSQTGSATTDIEIDLAAQAGRQDYTVTSNSYLEFQFKSDSQGAVHSIGWDDDLAAGGETYRKIYGSGSPPTNTTLLSPQYGSAALDADGYATYRVPIGSGLSSGQTRSLARVILTTDEGSNPNASSHFRNVQLIEDATREGLFFSETFAVPDHSLDRVTVEFGHTTFGTESVLDDTYRAQLFVGESSTPLDSASTIELLQYGDTAKIVVTHNQPSALGVSTTPLTNQYLRDPGEIIAIGLEANQFSREHLAERIADLNESLYDGAGADDIRELLTYTSDLYWSRFDESVARVGSLFDAINAQQRVGSGVVASKPQLYDLSGVSTDHLQFPILPVDMGVDLPNASALAFRRDVPIVDSEWLQLVGWQASALEHAILEEVVNTESISTVRGLWNAHSNDSSLADRGWDTSVWVIESVPSTTTSDERAVLLRGYIGDAPPSAFNGAGFDYRYTSSSTRFPSQYDTEQERRDFLRSFVLGRHTDSSAADPQNEVANTILDALTGPAATGVVRVLVPRMMSVVGGDDGWLGSVYLIERPDQAQYAIKEFGGRETNSGGAINGDELRPRPLELPATTFTNQAWAGDPVAVANGNMFRDEVDFAFAGPAGLPLDLTRHYDAQSDNDVGLGVGWVHSFTGLLYLDNDDPNVSDHDKVVWLRGDGSRHTFEWDPTSGEYEVPSSLMGHLEATRDSSSRTLTSFRYYEKDGLQYRFLPVNADNSEFGGRLVGRLANVFDRWGQEIKVNYTTTSGARVSNVFLRSDEPVTSSGQVDTSVDRRIDFTYVDSGTRYVEAAKKVGGAAVQTVRYRIGTGFAGEASSSRRLLYADPLGGSSLSGHETEYEYYTTGNSDLFSGDRRLGMMMSFTEPGAGETHLYEYYANRRAFRGRTVVNDALTPEQGGTADEVFTYDLFRNVAEFTDENGATTAYHHRDDGLLTKQIHPDGSFAAYEWGTSDNDRGLMRSSTNEVGATETFEYYAPEHSVVGTRRFGELERHTDAVGTVTKFTYYVSNSSSYRYISEVATVIEDVGGEHVTTSHERNPPGALLRTTIEDNGVVVSDTGLTERIHHGSSTARRLRGLPANHVEPRGLSGPEAVTWQPIFDRVHVSGGELTVRLSADGSATGGADIYVVADAVRLDRLDSGVLDSRVVDDTDAGFSKVVTAGEDRNVSGGSAGQYNGSSSLFHWVAGHDNHAEWSFRDLPDGDYRVSSLWVPWTGRDETARYEIVSGGASEIGGDIAFVDQTLGPAGFDPFVTEYEHDSTGRVVSTIVDGVRTMLREYNHHGAVAYEQDAAGVGTRYEYDALGRLTRQHLVPAGGYRLDFATASATVVPGQDSTFAQPAVLDVTPDGRGVALSGNVARAYSIDNYTVTANTVLDFWFRADRLAEMQGLILDTNHLHGSDTAPELRIALSGRQSWWGDYSGADGFPSYDGRVGDLIHYRIPIGQLASGVAGLQFDDVRYLTLFNDNNGTTAAGTSFFYDVRLSESDPAVSDYGRMDYTYTADGRLESEDSVVLASTRRFYDERGNLIRSLNPDQTFTSYEYDAVGNLIAETDGTGATTRFVYDDRNRLVQTIAADGASSVTRYNGAGQVTTTVDPLGHATSTSYDAAGRPLTIESRVVFDGVDEGAAIVTNQYDDLGRLWRTTDPNGVVTEVFYDEAGRPEREVIAHQNTLSEVVSETATTYGLLGRPTSVRTIDRTGEADHSEVEQSLTYDALGRVAVVTNPDGTQTRTVVDVNGREHVRFDELGRATESTYDAYGWLQEVAAPTPRDAASQPRTRFERDLAGRVTSEFIATGAVSGSTEVETEITTTYDAHGRVATVEEHDSSLAANAVTRTYYDAAGRAVAEVDALGSTTYQRLDGLGRVVATYAADPDGAGPAAAPATLYTLDAAGRVASTTGPTGLVTEFEYDTLGRLRSETDRYGEVASATRSYDYDFAGNLVAETDELNRTTNYVVDELGRVVKTTLPTPVGLVAPVTETVFDGLGVVQRVVEKRQGEADRVTEWDYDSRGRVIAERVLQGGVGSTTLRTTEFAYDDAGNVVRTVDPMGVVTLSIYDAVGRLVEEIVDAEQGRPSQDLAFASVVAASSPVVATLVSGATAVQLDATAGAGYRHFALPATHTIEHNTVLEFTLEDVGDLGPLRVGFDDDGAYAAVSDADHEQLVFDADGPSNDRVIERFADGRVRVRVPFGQLLTGAGGVTFDATHLFVGIDGGKATLSDFRLYETDAVHTQWTYTPRGDIATVRVASDPRGVSTEYAYDLRGRRVAETYDADHNADPHVEWTYNAVGSVTSESVRDDDEGAAPATYRTTAYRYDALHRQTMVIDPDPVTGAVADGAWTPAADSRSYTQFEYDAAGAVIATTNGEGETTRSEYDELGRVLAEYDGASDGASDGQSHKTTYSYYADGSLHTLTDAVGNTTTFEYDALGRLIKETNQLGDDRLTAYDAWGDVDTVTDRDGRTRRFDHDRFGRVEAEYWGAATTPQLTWQFDDANRITAQTDGVQTQSFAFDSLGRLTEQIDGRTDSNHDVRLTYDHGFFFPAFIIGPGEWRDRVTRTQELLDNSVAVETVATTHTDYDRQRRLSDIYDGSNTWLGGATVQFSYYADGALREVDRSNYPIGLVSAIETPTEYAYDGAGRLERITHDRGATLLRKFDYHYDRASRISAIDSVYGLGVDAGAPANTRSFAYDDSGQITSDDGLAIQYDENGNRLGAGGDDLTVLADNRLQADAEYDYEYNKEGARTKRTHRATGEVTLYEWDYRGRLTAVRTAAGAAALDFNTLTPTSVFGRDQGSGVATVDMGGARVHLAGNAWKAYEVNYEVTENTVLAFTFEAPVKGIIQGVALDSNTPPQLGATTGETRIQLFGDGFGWERYGTYQAGDGAVDYEIPLAELSGFTAGMRKWLALYNHNGTSSLQGESYFSNVRLFEAERTDYAYNADDQLVEEAIADEAIRHTYEGAQRVLSTRVDAATGALGVANRYLYGPTRDQALWDEAYDELGAVQGHWLLGDHQNTVGDLVDAWGVLRKSIEYDAFGQVTREVDYDASGAAIGTRMDFSATPALGHSTQDGLNGPSDSTPVGGGRGVEVSGDAWKAYAFDYTVTPDTVLSFRYRSDAEGLVHALMLDNNTSHNAINEERFQLSGKSLWWTEFPDWLHVYDDREGSWVQYVIPIGSLPTFTLTDINYLRLVLEQKAGHDAGAATFQDVWLYEADANGAPIGSVTTALGYAGKPWDAASETWIHDARRYDPDLGRFASQDPTGFSAGDANLYRYVRNSAVNYVDPTGLVQAGNPLDAMSASLGGGFIGGPGGVSPYTGPGLLAPVTTTPSPSSFGFTSFVNNLVGALPAPRAFNPGPTNVAIDPSILAPLRPGSLEQRLFVEQQGLADARFDRNVALNSGSPLQAAAADLVYSVASLGAGTPRESVGARIGGTLRVAGALPGAVASTVAIASGVGAPVGVGGLALSGDQFYTGVQEFYSGRYQTSLGAGAIQYVAGDGAAGQTLSVAYDVVGPGIASSTPRLASRFATRSAVRANTQVLRANLNHATLHASDLSPVASQAVDDGLAILNPQFVPDTRRVLQNITNKVTGDILADTTLLRDVLGRRAYSHLVRGTDQADRVFGRGVESLVARTISTDEALSSILVRATQRGPNGRFIRSPDFIGIEGDQIRLLDITTLQNVPAHLSRPAGTAVEYVIQPGLRGPIRPNFQ